MLLTVTMMSHIPRPRLPVRHTIINTLLSRLSILEVCRLLAGQFACFPLLPLLPTSRRPCRLTESHPLSAPPLHPLQIASCRWGTGCARHLQGALRPPLGARGPRSIASLISMRFIRLRSGKKRPPLKVKSFPKASHITV